MRTVYNQYDSMVRLLEKWLKERGVDFELGVRVTDLVSARAQRASGSNGSCASATMSMRRSS
jgi:myosin-crossreactive antigen